MRAIKTDDGLRLPRMGPRSITKRWLLAVSLRRRFAASPSTWLTDKNCSTSAEDAKGLTMLEAGTRPCNGELPGGGGGRAWPRLGASQPKQIAGCCGGGGWPDAMALANTFADSDADELDEELDESEEPEESDDESDADDEPRESPGLASSLGTLVFSPGFPPFAFLPAFPFFFGAPLLAAFTFATFFTWFFCALAGALASAPFALLLPSAPAFLAFCFALASKVAAISSSSKSSSPSPSPGASSSVPLSSIRLFRRKATFSANRLKRASSSSRRSSLLSEAGSSAQVEATPAAPFDAMSATTSPSSFPSSVMRARLAAAFCATLASRASSPFAPRRAAAFNATRSRRRRSFACCLASFASSAARRMAAACATR
mmetsp:Transcript_84156/g.242992  ORF Transcript_84156/g.242992 Transcript_84156/m.242992 type:complete len:374 (-) Transcript_84156:457-1578(-)